MMRPPTDGASALQFDYDDDYELLLSDGVHIGLGPVDPHTLEVASRVIDASGIVALLDQELALRANTRGAGGRPLRVPYRAAAILMLLAALEGQPLHVKKVALMIVRRLTPRQRRELGIPQRELGLEKIDSWEDRCYRSVRSMLNLMDPYYLRRDRRKTMTKDDYAAFEERIDRAEFARRKAVLQEFGDAILYATWLLLPIRYRKLFRGYYAIDGTAFRSSAIGKQKRGHMHSVEPEAGWYSRDGDHNGERVRKVDKLKWAFESTIVVAVRRSKLAPVDIPLLALSLNLDRPGRDVAGAAVACLSSVRRRGLPPGYLIADRAYFANQNEEKLHLPLQAMGIRAVTDYKKNQLGIVASFEGAVLIEGNWYSPTMPTHLVEATIDYRVNRSINFDTWDARIKARQAYRLTRKALPDTDGYVVMQCPASKGKRSTLQCPIKGIGPSVAPGAFPVLTSQLPTTPGRVCTNKASLTFPPDAGGSTGIRLSQDLQFGSKDWRAVYGHGRNTIESYNDSMKDRMGAPKNRVLRGLVAQHFLTVLVAAAVNIFKIRDFLADRKREDETGIKKRKTRRKLTTGPWSDKYGAPAESSQTLAQPTPITRPRRT